MLVILKYLRFFAIYYLFMIIIHKTSIVTSRMSLQFVLEAWIRNQVVCLDRISKLQNRITLCEGGLILVP